jgi:hypothetical protein
LERADTASSLLEKPVILKVKLENSVIYPGQEVPLLVDLDNCSNRVVKFIKVSLIMVRHNTHTTQHDTRTTAHAHGATRTQHDTRTTAHAD